MKLIRSLCAILLVTALVPAWSVTAKTSDITLERQNVHLQLNGYYVLYSYPRGPYIDPNHRLMVPLRSVSELMGATVSYQPTSKTAVIKLGQQELSLTIGSRQARVNGQTTQMDTVPAMQQQAMFVPIRFILDHFPFETKWDPHDRILSMEDESFLQGGDNVFHYMRTGDRHNSEEAAAFDVLRPLSYDLQFLTSGDRIPFVDLTIRARNQFGAAIPEGREDLHRVAIYLRNGDFLVSQDETAVPYVSERKRPAVGNDEVFTRNSRLGAQPGDQLKYVLVLGRVLKIDR